MSRGDWCSPPGECDWIDVECWCEGKHEIECPAYEEEREREQE